MLDRVSFRNFKSLKSLSIDLSPLTVLVGPNGSGKSSVLAGMHLLSQATYLRETRFVGPRDPQRLASHGRPPALQLAMGASGDDSLTLAIRIAPHGEGHQRVFDITVNGPAGPLAATSRGDDIAFAAVLDDPRLRRFASAVYLHLDAAVLCRTSTTDEEEPRMAADGEALASTLAWMAGAKPDTLTAIAADLARIVPGVRRILTHRERLQERVMEKVDIDGQAIWRPVNRARLGDRFSLEFDDGSEIPADLLSEGTVLALGLLTKLQEPGRPRLVLLDDIDRGLHLGAQASLVAVLRALMQRDPELQIVCSTHSTYLLNLFDPAEVRVLALDADRATHAKALPEHPDFDKWRFGTQTGELWAALGDAWVTGQTAP